LAEIPRVVFCNAGPLIALAKLNRLTLLSRLYPNLAVPRAVHREVVEEGLSLGAPDATVARLFFARSGCPIVDAAREVVDSFQPIGELDLGERALLALARHCPGALVLLDDEQARNEARRLGLRVKGTLGVLVSAYRAGFVDLEEVEMLLLTLAERTDIWISRTLCEQVLAELLHSP